MSIPDAFRFDKEGNGLKGHWLRPYFVTITILLVALLSFGLGRLTGGERGGVVINYDPENLIASKPSQKATEESVVASSQGARYYFSHCRNTISEKNKVSFASPALAEKAGYTLAANCKPK